MIFYNLMTLNAAAMLDHVVKRQHGNTHNERPEFRYDFKEKTTENFILESTERHADNALFYQLIAGRYGDENVSRYRRQADCILKSLFYVDFESVFSSQKKRENEKKKVGYSIYDSSKWSEEAIDAICSVLFEDGFSISYEDGEVRTYIPFDKSGSMSRHYAMTFIDKELFPEVDRRLRLGIDFSSVNVVLSKYFAYRGLYLTDGVRADEDSDHVLNQNTVLVIKDDTHDYMRNGEVQNVPVITVDKDLLLNGEFGSVETEHPIRLNSFDGEGMVTPFFAEYMNRARKQEVYMKQPGVSFQIRMPYIKGMLHQVDFHRFFREQLSQDDYYIEDIFGIPRRIADVQIVLTESMFKCAKWLADYTKIHSEIKDPMEWFFDMFHRYGHALYVCNTDSNMGAQKVSLTYQFLNTMDISPDALENLINRHLNEAHSIPKTGAKYAVDVTEYLAEVLYEDEDVSSSVPAWRYALDLNPDFVKDPYVRAKLRQDEISRVKDICSGRIIVDGVLKYLSGDLLALLIHMIYNRKAESDGGIGRENGLGRLTDDGLQIDANFNRDAVTRLRKHLIRTGKFYTADHARMKLRTDGRYSILRNPHLSRNEQCSLRPYVPDQDDEGNIYNRYFSHLKNVIMFPYESIDALSLGGADYDGDKVKVILDRTVNSAILKGSYVLKGKEYVRKLPVVEIPSLGANREPAPDIISYKLVKSTFANQVGLISNLAIRLGKLEYSSENKEPSRRNKCAECTLATGLEIDAVKTGVRPELKDLKKAAPPGQDYFLLREEIIENLRPEEIERLKVEPLKGGGSGRYGGEVYSVSRPRYTVRNRKQYKKMFDAEAVPLDAPAAIIDRLPGYLLRDLSGDWKEKSGPDNVNNCESDTAEDFGSDTEAVSVPDIAGGSRRSGEVILFRFQMDEASGTYDRAWAGKLRKESDGIQKLSDTSALIKAYRKVANDARYIRKQREKARRSNNKNKIWFLLGKLFDISAEGLPVTHTEIPDAIEIAHADLRNIFETTGEVERAIERMITLDWMFASAEEREGILYKILGTESLLEETKEILLCDEPDAFDFLKFYLYDIKDKLFLESTAEEIDLSKRELSKNLEGYSAGAYEKFLHEYIVGQNRKEPKSIWNFRIIDLCREDLAEEKMFNGDFDRALKFYYASRSSDPGRYFLWEVFRTGEILRNVYIKPKE